MSPTLISALRVNYNIKKTIKKQTALTEFFMEKTHNYLLAPILKVEFLSVNLNNCLIIFPHGKGNRPFPSCCEPHYESEAKCKTFHMKISFLCI